MLARVYATAGSGLGRYSNFMAAVACSATASARNHQVHAVKSLRTLAPACVIILAMGMGGFFVISVTSG